MQRCEDTKSRYHYLVKVLSSFEPAKPAFPDWQREKSLGHGGHVGTVVMKWVPLGDFVGRRRPCQLAPKIRGNALHGNY